MGRGYTERTIGLYVLFVLYVILDLLKNYKDTKTGGGETVSSCLCIKHTTPKVGVSEFRVSRSSLLLCMCLQEVAAAVASLAAEGHATAYPGYRNNGAAATNSPGKVVLTDFVQSNVRRDIVKVATDPAYA